MKYSPKIYAQTLISALDSGNAKTIARNFWYQLQKNNQYKDMAKVFDFLDQEYASINNKILVSIISSKVLEQIELKDIEQKIKEKFNQEPIIKQIIKKNITGIVVKANDVEINLSVEGKIQKLKQAINT